MKVRGPAGGGMMGALRSLPTEQRRAPLSPEEQERIVAASRWAIVWPNYINARKTLAQGRRVAADRCVDNPTCTEIAEACKTLGLETVIEPYKKYPRDQWINQIGRVRVRLVDPETKEEIMPRKKLLSQLGAIIYDLPSRVDARQAMVKAAIASKATEESAASSSAAASSSKKTNQKKKRNKKRR